ncbi:MAG: cell wall hydrolase [Clostridiales bacterium]|nr:cell wall hydrolase [Clostridiales bacterium]
MFVHVGDITYAQEVTAPAHRIVLNGQYIHPNVQPVESKNGILLPLRYVSETLGANVSWDSDSRTALVSRDGALKTCKGEIVNDTMMAPVSFFADMFDAQTTCVNKLNLIIMNTDGGYISEQAALALLPSYNGYSEEDLNWLAKIVEAEAQGETYASKLGVASVIINRRDSGKYPATIKGVIFDKKHGVQFTPTANGSVYNEPSASSFMAALEALEGRNNAPETLFFMNPKIATTNWISKNRQYAFTIGGHSYYY